MVSFFNIAIYCSYPKKKYNSSFVLNQIIISLTKFIDKSINIYDIK